MTASGKRHRLRIRGARTEIWKELMRTPRGRTGNAWFQPQPSSPEAEHEQRLWLDAL